MWWIIGAEFKYSRGNFAAFLSMILFMLVYGSYRPGAMPFFLASLMLFLAVNNWNAFRIKEKRDFQLAQLPVSVRQRALARILVIMICCAAFLVLHVACRIALGQGVNMNIRVLLLPVGLIISIFPLALMFRDRFLGTRALKPGKILIFVLLGAAVALNIYGLLTFRRMEATGA